MANLSNAASYNHLRQRLLVYIRDRLSSDIVECGHTPYEHTSVVEWHPVSKCLKLLIGGVDLQTHSNASRDVLIDGYVRVVVGPLIKERFPLVNNVTFMYTWDDGYELAVTNAGGLMTNADVWNVKTSFVDCMKIFGDSHPCIQGCVKSPSSKNLHVKAPTNFENTSFTTKTFFRRFDLHWYITDETHIIGIDGTVLWGLDQITSNSNLLPAGVVLQLIDGPYPYVLRCGNADFFRDEIFKYCTF